MNSPHKTCARCAAEYPRSHDYFPYRNKERGWLSSWCKRCHTEHRKIPAVNAAMLEAQRTRRRAAISCHVCGTKDRAPGTRYCDTCALEIRRSKKRYDKGVYKSRLRKATPAWANKFFIKEIYALARVRSAMLGMSFHVDHVIPIRGANVCGLNVEGNLRVLPGKLNQFKSNRFDI